MLFCSRFIKDGVNFGLSSDDSGMTGYDLNYEFTSASENCHLKMTEEQLIQTVYNSARSSFLPEKEKEVLLKHLDEKMEEYHRSS